MLGVFTNEIMNYHVKSWAFMSKNDLTKRKTRGNVVISSQSSKKRVTN